MKHTSAMLAALAGLILLAGCGQMNPTSNSTTDPAAQYASDSGVESSTQAMPDEFETSTYEDGDAAKPDITDPDFSSMKGSLQTDVAIQPAFWFRLIRNHQRRFTIEFERPDTMTLVANVKVTDRLLGTFNVITKPDTIEGQITERSWIKKPLADTGVRKAVFVRHKLDDNSSAGEAEDREDGFRDGWSPWRLTAISGHEITSDNGTRAIQSVEVQSGDVDVTITDPLALVRRADLPRIAPGARVHVIATSADPTDVLVLYTRWGRMRMRPGAVSGQFEAHFLAPSAGGLRHIAVNALSHGTLFDNALPYDSKAWGVPFVIAPSPVATTTQP
jgi:hypothetical protein